MCEKAAAMHLAACHGYSRVYLYTTVEGIEDLSQPSQQRLFTSSLMFSKSTGKPKGP